MQCTNLPVEKYRFLNLFQGGAGRARKYPNFLSQWPKSQHYLNYLYSNIYQNIPLFKHKVHPGLITNLLWSPRLSYKYDTNILHEIRYSRQRWASLYRTRKNILLRSLQMCFSQNASWKIAKCLQCSSRFLLKLQCRKSEEGREKNGQELGLNLSKINLDR